MKKFTLGKPELYKQWIEAMRDDPCQETIGHTALWDDEVCAPCALGYLGCVYNGEKSSDAARGKFGGKVYERDGYQLCDELFCYLYNMVKFITMFNDGTGRYEGRGAKTWRELAAAIHKRTKYFFKGVPEVDGLDG